jgi:hypothetical protein
MTETLLVFVGVPLAVFGLVALLTLGGGARRTPRYRPGRPFAFAPVWFTSAERPGGSSGDRVPVTGPVRASIEAAAVGSTRPATKKGGARGTW